VLSGIPRPGVWVRDDARGVGSLLRDSLCRTSACEPPAAKAVAVMVTGRTAACAPRTFWGRLHGLV